MAGEIVGYREAGDHLVELSEKEVARQRSGMAMVFQQFNLFPHRTVLQNLIEAPVLVKREPRAEATERAVSMLARVGLAGQGEGLPRPALRRPAATRRNSPGPDHETETDAVR